MIAPDTVDRLAKLCGMLGSAHDGERAAAAMKATAMLQSLGMTWRELVEAAAMPSGSNSRTIEERTLAEWAELVGSLVVNPPFLHEGEAEFLQNMFTRTHAGRGPSRKQRAWIQRIAERRA